MLDWVRSHQRSAIICGLTAILPLLVYLNMLFGVLGLRAEYVNDIDRLQPRIARLQGVKSVEAQLTESAGGVQQQMGRLVYPATADHASVAAALQKDIRQLMTQAGLSVSNSQVLPVREEEKFDFIGLKLTVSGDIAALDETLARLAEFTPLVIVESLEAWPTRQRRNKGEPEAQVVTASVRLVSLRAVI